jgi:hypothetical protein
MLIPDDVRFSGEERRAHFGDQFLFRIYRAAQAVVSDVEARLAARPALASPPWALVNENTPRLTSAVLSPHGRFRRRQIRKSFLRNHPDGLQPRFH